MSTEPDFVSSLYSWYQARNWTPFPFQLEMAEAYTASPGGLLNAPTGSGKTFALALPVLLQAAAENDRGKGLRLLWITPLKALSKDIAEAIRSACEDLKLDWQVAVRSGDTSGKERQEIDRQEPQVLVTTPESLHLLLSRKAYSARFSKLRCLVFDEWHELLGSKRGVQAELALSRLRGLLPDLKVWGISATVGNLDEALEVLHPGNPNTRLVRSGIRRRPEMTTLIPEKVESFPWSGHLGIRMLADVLPVLRDSDSTLVFTNTRSQTEIWYRELLEASPDLAGRLAITVRSARNCVPGWNRRCTKANSKRWYARAALTWGWISVRSIAWCRSAVRKAWPVSCSAPAAAVTAPMRRARCGLFLPTAWNW
jgi:ATP-dependent Lhr-like helicase